MNYKEFLDFFKTSIGQVNLPDALLKVYVTQAVDFISAQLSGRLGSAFLFAGLEEGRATLNVAKYLTSIKDVWLVSSDRTVLGKMSGIRLLDEFLDRWPNRSLVGTPTEYTRVPSLANMEAQDATTPFMPAETFSSSTLDGGDHLQIMFNCIADRRYGLRVYGARRLEALVQDTDTNLLTVKYPLLLVTGTLHFYELTQRHYEQADVLLKQVINQTLTINHMSTMAEVEELGDTIE